MSMTSWASRASADVGPLSEDSESRPVRHGGGPGAGRAVKLGYVIDSDVELDGVKSHVG